MKVLWEHLDYRAFTCYTAFTKAVKAGVLVKVLITSFFKERERLVTSLLKIPIVEQCEWVSDKRDGFNASVVFTDGTSVGLDVVVLQNAYPAMIAKVIAERIADGSVKNKQSEDRKKLKNVDDIVYPVIMAPYISEESAKQCEKLKVGYVDMSGNSRLQVRSLYMSEQGHPNQYIQKRTLKTVFDPMSKVSSIILREIMHDVSYKWKLSLLSEKLQCSIGQVSKVKNYLLEQLWAEMPRGGLRILDAEAIMLAWSKAYSGRDVTADVLDCYSLDSLPDFEAKSQEIRIKHGIDSYLTGIAGGVQYAPVVRYNKVHLIVHQKNANAFIQAAGCKVVGSGANIQINVINSDEFLHDARELNGYLVASPVQIYLDCMKLKGRGEEVANAIFAKEIEK